MNEREDIAAYIATLKAGEGLSETAIRDGYTRFKAEKNAKELADIAAKEVTHDGDPRLSRHVLNAVATANGSFRKENRNSPRKIDLLPCSVLANGARHAVKGKKPRRAPMVL